MPREQRREQLIAVARGMFAERGYEAASIEEVAKRAGVSKPVVYDHFDGKETLHGVVVDREVRHLLRMITAALDAPHPRQMLEQSADAFLAYIEEERDGFVILIRDAPVEHTARNLHSVIGEIATHVEKQLRAELQRQGYDPRHAPLYAEALVGMVAFVGEWWLDAGTPSRREVGTQVVNLAWNGLKDLAQDRS